MQFSIIIPTFSRPGKLRMCLDSISRVDYPVDQFEVIVVDDGGDIPLESVINVYSGRFDLNLLRQENAGPASARNSGAEHARGDYLVFIDDDCSVGRDWLHQLGKNISKHPGCIIGGRTKNGIPGNLFSETSQAMIDYLYSYYNSQESEYRFFTSNNFALPAGIFHEAKGFDSSMSLAAGEDRELCHRLRKRDCKMVYAPDVVIKHFHELSLPSFLRQHFNYGKGAALFHDRRKQQADERSRIEPSCFYIKLLLHPWTRGDCRYPLMTVFLLCIMQCANTAGFLCQRLFRD